MNTEDSIRHNGSHWHAVVAVHKAPPQLNAIPSLALVEKPIDPIDIRRFVVSAQQKEGLRIAELVRQQQGQGFYRVQTPIHVIPEKQVVGSRRYPALLKDPQEVLELTVQIPADLHRSTEFQEHTNRLNPAHTMILLYFTQVHIKCISPFFPWYILKVLLFFKSLKWFLYYSIVWIGFFVFSLQVLYVL